MSKVLVVTGAHLGWDCVVGVFKDEQSFLDSGIVYESYEEGEECPTLKEWFINHDNFVAHWKEVK